MKKQCKFPSGWDEKRVRRVLAHYETQTDAEALAEDESVVVDRSHTTMAVPKALVPVVRQLIAMHRDRRKAGA